MARVPFSVKLDRLDSRIAHLHKYRLKARANSLRMEAEKIAALKARNEMGRMNLWNQSTQQLESLLDERQLMAEQMGIGDQPYLLMPNPDTIEWDDPIEWDAILDPEIGR